jgi:hypothetical protein
MPILCYWLLRVISDKPVYSTETEQDAEDGYNRDPDIKETRCEIVSIGT